MITCQSDNPRRKHFSSNSSTKTGKEKERSDIRRLYSISVGDIIYVQVKPYNGHELCSCSIGDS